MKLLAIIALSLTASLAADIRPIGIVQSIENSGKKLILKTDGGPELQVISDDATKVLKIKPGETTLTGATPLQLSDLATGDRVLIRGTVSEDQKSIPAKQIIVMTKTELASKHAADQAEWTTRGVFGIVSAIDPEAKTITVNVRSSIPGSGQSKPVVVKLSDNAMIRRYAPDSIKFSDAQVSSLADIRAGDQLRARGDKAADGSSITAQEVVAGTFHNIAATVISIDATAQTIKVTNLDTKNPVLIKTTSDSSIRRMPPMMAQFMAMRLNGESQSGRPQGGPAPGGARVGGGPGGMFGPGGPGGPPNPGQMIDRMPAIKLDELKAGDALIISAPAGKNPNELTATTLVAGVEPILTAPSKDRQMMLGNWNLDLGGGMGMAGMQ